MLINRSVLKSLLLYNSQIWLQYDSKYDNIEEPIPSTLVKIAVNHRQYF